MLFVKLYVGVFHIFGGRFIVYDVEIKGFSSRFYSAVLGRKPLTCSHESSLLDRRWGPPGRGACPFGSPAPPPLQKVVVSQLPAGQGSLRLHWACLTAVPST